MGRGGTGPRSGERIRHMRTRQSIIDRIMAKVSPEPNSGCWLWTGSLSGGYGAFHNKRGTRRAHRLLFLLTGGEIPAGFDLDHLCRVRSCVNPQHLEAVTRTTNARRGDRRNGGDIAIYQRSKANCPAGHLYDQGNTYVDRHGHRRCRACAQRRDKERRA